MFDQLQQDLKQAMLARDEVKTSTLRLLISELKNFQIQKGEELSEADIVSAIQKEIKKRNEAASSFRSGGREDSAIKEESEAKVLESYLPAQLSDEELTKIVEEAITKVGATSMQDMGKVIGAVRSQVGTGADGSRISNLVKEKLLV